MRASVSYSTRVKKTIWESDQKQLMNCYFFFKIPGEVTAAPSLQKKKKLGKGSFIDFSKAKGMAVHQLENALL